MRRTSLPRLSLPIAAVLGLAGVASGTVAATSAGAATASTKYAALGDQFAGGEGAPELLTGFDESSGACHRTALAWPRLLAGAKGLSLDATVSGATSSVAGHLACTDVTTATLVGGPTSQLSRVSTMSPRPTLVTLTVGANDARMRALTLSCKTGVSCDADVSSARTLVRGKLPNRLAGVFAQVKAATKARLIVVGYPQLYAPPSTNALGQCVGMTSHQLTELQAYARDLDATMAAAAKAAGAEYVSMLDAFQGRELCTTSPLVNPVVVTDGALAPRSGYPTELGQQVMATRVAAYLTRYPAAPNLAPVPWFTYKRQAGSTSRVVLNAAASKDPDGTVTRYAWTVNGKIVATTKATTITVPRGKTQRVKLTVTDNRGAKASTTRTVSPTSTSPR